MISIIMLELVDTSPSRAYARTRAMRKKIPRNFRRNFHSYTRTIGKKVRNTLD